MNGGCDTIHSRRKDSILPSTNRANSIPLCQQDKIVLPVPQVAKKKAATKQIRKVFKQVFIEEYHDLVKEKKVTSGYSGFNMANSMQGIGGSL